MRKWTRKNGQEFEAEFISFTPGKGVVLKQPDGKEITVKLPGLSEEDRKYVRHLTKPGKAGELEVAGSEAPADTSVTAVPDQPPADSSQQREWLQAHIVKDAQSAGTFDSDATSKVSTSLQSLPEDQVALLCQYYLLTRSKTEQDAYLYSLQQQGNTEEQVNEVKAANADLLTEMQNQGDACYAQIQTLGEPAQYLAQIEYASVPGWCVSQQCYVPDWYYDNGSFVGPCYNARYCGVYAASVYRAYHDAGSRFYKAYHGVGDRVYRRHTAQMAQRSAKYFREHDYHRALAHDRLVKPSSPLRRTAQHDAHSSHLSEHGEVAAKPEQAKLAAKTESVSKPATKSVPASKTAKVETSKPAAKTIPGSKSAAKTESVSKPATKSVPASKTAKAETSKPAAKASPGGKSAEKPAKATKPAAKPAKKSAPASKPAGKEEKKK